MDDYESIIDFAIEMEKEAALFYENAANDETRQDAKSMLKEFALEENRHKYLLQNLDCTGECTLVTGNYKFEWISDIKRSDYLVDMAWTKAMTYRDILHYAMKMEERALKLYNEMLLKSETEKAKNVFKILCQEEAKHKLGLEKLYDEYMAEMGD